MLSFRRVLFQIHLWTGLIAGIFFILLGLSGSALVYPSLLQSSAPVPKATSQGAALPLERILAAARDTTPENQDRDAALTLPQAAGDPVMVEFNPFIAQRGGRGEGRAAGGGRRGNAAPDAQAQTAGRAQLRRGAIQQFFVDPVSGRVLGTRTPTGSPWVGIAHQMHEAMLFGRTGRTLVAWLGVGMLFLGLSGLYLWWPKKGQWKFAFGVRRNARGFRLYRDIHGMLGIWFWLVFLVVTATSIPLGFPTVLGMLTSNAPRGGPPPGFAQAQAVDIPDGAAPLPLATLVADAEKASGAKARTVVIPVQPNRPINVVLQSGDDDGPRNMTLNPYTGTVLNFPRQIRDTGLNRRTIEQLHGGAGWGPVWKFLVFLSGFLPLIFVVTGFMMWLKKRRNKTAVARAAAPSREPATAFASEPAE